MEERMSHHRLIPKAVGAMSTAVLATMSPGQMMDSGFNLIAAVRIYIQCLPLAHGHGMQLMTKGRNDGRSSRSPVQLRFFWFYRTVSIVGKRQNSRLKED